MLTTSLLLLSVPYLAPDRMREEENGKITTNKVLALRCSWLVRDLTCGKLRADLQGPRSWALSKLLFFSPEQSSSVSSHSFCQSRLHAPSGLGWKLLGAQRPLTLPCPPCPVLQKQERNGKAQSKSPGGIRERHGKEENVCGFTRESCTPWRTCLKSPRSPT